MVATKAIDDKEQGLNKPDGKSKARKKLFLIRTAFLFTWLSFSCIIFVIAILADINWMRPSLEQLMAQSVRRNVKLGQLSWHFGWRGFSVHTSRLLVAERTGDPFLMAGNCEIGFSFLPLLIGIGRIEYVDMQNPLFMAVRTGTKNWNFDDLLVASPDIDYIQIRSGHIFVVDREPDIKYRRFPDTELNNVQIRLQRAGNFTPAQTNMSFDLAGQEKKAQFALESKTWGQNNKPWWDKKGHFELTTKRFTAENWQTVGSLIGIDNKDLSYFNPISRLSTMIPQSIFHSENPPQIFIPSSGQFDFHAIADGVPSNKLDAELQLKVDNLLFRARNKTSVNIPATSLTARVELKNNSVSWNKAVIKIPDYQLLFNSSGQTQNASDGNLENYQWNIVGLLGDLKKLNPLASFVCNNIAIDNTGSGGKDLRNLNGKLFLDLRFNKDKEKGEYIIEAKAADINIDGITPLLLTINRLTHNKADLAGSPFEGTYRQELDLSKQALFSGIIIGKSDQGLVLKDCDLVDDQMSWKIAGQTDKDGHWHELVISNKDLLLSKLSNKIDRDSTFGRQVKAILGLSPNSQIELNGKAQIEAKISQSQNEKNEVQNKLLCETIFNDASLKTSQPRLNIRHLSGVYECGSDKLGCKNIHFSVSDNPGNVVDIDANMPANINEALHFHLHGRNIDFIDLQEVLRLFHLDTKFLDNWHLAGNLADIDLLINGTQRVPVITVIALPDDLVFTLANTKQSIHASSGKIIYANNVYSLERVNLSSQNSKCTISMALKNASSSCKLEKLSLQIGSVDLSEAQSYVASFNSNGLVDSWSALTKKFQIANLKGSISGTIEYSCKQEKQRLNSMIEINGASLKCGQQKLFCRNLKGKAHFTDNDLVLQEITGNIDDTSFTVHGKLANYKDKYPQWQGEFSSQVTPDHLNDLVALFSFPEQKCSINLQAKKAIFVKLKSHNHNANSSQSFTLSADPDASLSITVGGFTFYQPNKKMIISSRCSFDEQKLVWHNLNFDFAGSSINVQGIVNNFRSIKENSKLDPVYDLQLQTSDYIPANYVGQIMSYGVINSGLTGQVKAVLSLQGPNKALAVSGKIFLSDISIPDLYLNHIIGTMSFQPVSGPLSIPSLLQLDKFSYGEIQLSQASGNLIWQLTENSSGQTTADLSQIYLKNFVARIAQGQLTADGYTDLKANKAHLKLTVNGANLAQLWPQLTSYQIKAAGLLNAHFNVDTAGSTAKELEQSMVGYGQINIGNGSFSRLSQLHARLNQVNLIHQGIFGFNLNNLMQSVLPTKASEFNTIDTAFGLDKDTLTIRHVLYDGKDIKFSAAGKANLALHNLDMDIAGVMPRVSNSVLGGKLGELSREITLQKLLDGVTMHKLDKLPSLPLIGGLAGGPEVFTCRILAPYDQPKLISQSIQKSFRWLHNR